MKDYESGLTAERLREVLHYDPETGHFRWLVMNSFRKPVGSPAGDKKPSGYVLVGIDGFRYRAHRLAWLYMKGEWPTLQVDHIDNDRSNNRWVNLREATNQQNQGNSRVSKNCASGVKGVFWSKGRAKWQVKLTFNRQQIHGGFYHDLDAAAFAYRQLATKYFGEFARFS